MKKEKLCGLHGIEPYDNVRGNSISAHECPDSATTGRAPMRNAIEVEY
jgi:hypothetical protein